MVLKGSLEKSIKVESPVPVADHEVIPLLRSTERILKLVYLEAKALKSQTIDTEHLLLAILKDENALVTRFLSELDVDYQSVRRMVETESPTAKADYPRDEDDEGQSFSGGPGKGQPALLLPNLLLIHLSLIILALTLQKLQKKVVWILLLAGKGKLSVSLRSYRDGKRIIRYLSVNQEWENQLLLKDLP